MREKTTLLEFVKSVVSQMTLEDANSEIQGIGTGYKGDYNYYVIELKSGAKIEVPIYKEGANN